MIEPRLATHVWIESVKRRVSAMGGFAMVLAKGDAVSGAILVVCLEKGRNSLLCERMPSLDGGSEWQPIWPQGSEKYRDNAEISAYWARRKARDPDLWVIELDVAHIAQLDDILFHNA